MKPAAVLAVAALLATGVFARQSTASAAANVAAVKRIYVSSFGDDTAAKLFQATVVNALVETKRFAVTENPDAADAILKGTGIERTSHEVHAFGEGTAVGTAAAVARVDADSSSATAAAAAASRHVATSDSQLDTETVQHASVAIRLVNRNGDVIWSTTQQSDGGKYAGATADAVDQCVKQLLRDADREAAAKKP